MSLIKNSYIISLKFNNRQLFATSTLLSIHINNITSIVKNRFLPGNFWFTWKNEIYLERIYLESPKKKKRNYHQDHWRIGAVYEMNEMVIYGVLWIKAITEYIPSFRQSLFRCNKNIFHLEKLLWKKNSLRVPLLDTRRYSQALEKVPSKWCHWI